jgi:hypothetical protein
MSLLDLQSLKSRQRKGGDGGGYGGGHGGGHGDGCDSFLSFLLCG